MAYWIMTYGCIRVMSIDKHLLAVSYLIESTMYAHELVVHKSTYPYYSMAVSAVSMILALACISL